MKKNLLFLFILLFISFVSSTDVALSPPQLDFNGGKGQEICGVLTLSTNDNVLIGEDRWAKEGYVERKFSEHNLEADLFDIEVSYPQRIEVKNREEVNICIKGKNGGIYHGLLLYRAENDPAGVGIWMTVNLTETSPFAGVTGAIIGTGKENFKGLLIISSLILTIVLLGILLKLRR